MIPPIVHAFLHDSGRVPTKISYAAVEVGAEVLTRLSASHSLTLVNALSTRGSVGGPFPPKISLFEAIFWLTIGGLML